MAAEIGTPLMPWQRMVAEVAGELVGGVPAYREVIVTVPRQSGKTTLLLAFEVDRALAWGRPTRVAYSAQDGRASANKLIIDQAPILQGSKSIRPTIRQVYRAMGMEAIIFKNGSRIDPMAGTKSSGHGRTLDLGIIDEAFDDFDDRREQSMSPAMITKRDAQLWVVSTAGTEDSLYLRQKVEMGRDAVANDERSGIAYFEWSADDDADPDDEQVWWACMPALGHTVRPEEIRLERRKMTDSGFRRAFLNQWTKADERIIPGDVWRAVCSTEVRPDGGLVFAADATPDQAFASIVVADSVGRCELIEHRAGTSWVGSALVELVAKFGGEVVIDVTGTVGHLADSLPVECHGVNAREMAHSCSWIYDAIADRKIVVLSHPDLDAAVEAARKRPLGDAWAWKRKSVMADISPLVALTLAAARAGRKPEPTVDPGLVVFDL